MMQRRVYNRAQAEAEFVHALTRQVGYTAGAFSIRRMAGIVTLFDDASAYQFELTKRLTAVGQAGESLTEKYATDILSFASELGIISKLQGASVPHLSKYILTDAGVSIRAARAVSPELEKIILEHLILENDADAYLRVLWLLGCEQEKTSDSLAADFRDLVFESRQARFSWMQEVFPSKPVLMRLVKTGGSQVHWLKTNRLNVISLDRPSSDFGRHHFSPRKSWAVELDHYDPENRILTPAGRKFLDCAKWEEDRVANHWISPTLECMAFLRVPQRGELFGGTAPTLDLLRPKGELQEPNEDLILATRKFLHDAFGHIRLVHARQALTAPVTYFLLDQERRLGARYEKEILLQIIARTYGDEFEFFSSRSGALAYYQLRKNNNG